jgi:hypothetical protein
LTRAIRGAVIDDIGEHVRHEIGGLRRNHLLRHIRSLIEGFTVEVFDTTDVGGFAT